MKKQKTPTEISCFKRDRLCVRIPHACENHISILRPHNKAPSHPLWKHLEKQPAEIITKEQSSIRKLLGNSILFKWELTYLMQYIQRKWIWQYCEKYFHLFFLFKNFFFNNINQYFEKKIVSQMYVLETTLQWWWPVHLKTNQAFILQNTL